MKWAGRRGLWTAGPFTVCAQLDERTKVVLFELYDSTRFVKSFASAQEAKKHAEQMGCALEEAS